MAYHVWPALMENDVVIVKGEAVTKRGALVCTFVKKYVKGSRFEHGFEI